MNDNEVISTCFPADFSEKRSVFPSFEGGRF